MKKIFLKVFLLLILMVMIFEVALPLKFFRSFVYAQESGYKTQTVDETGYYKLTTGQSLGGSDRFFDITLYYIVSGDSNGEGERKIEVKNRAGMYYLTADVVYYVPIGYTIKANPEKFIIDDLEIMMANLTYSLANGLHFLVSCALGQTITIDDLVFNKYAETNISYFETEAEAGELASSLIYGNGSVGGLNNVITKWYAIFQKISLMGYMMILVYMGIRILLGATADQKASYQRLFVDWVIGIAILLLFPYAMKYMIEINVAIVRTVDANKDFDSGISATIVNTEDAFNDFSKNSIDDQIDWSKGDDYMSKIAYAAKTSNKLGLSITFLIMTWQLIALTVHYFKRLFMIAFLIIIFPLVALSYAVDKIADGKTQAFNTWAKEFMLNVFVQSFHAIVYVFVCSTIYAASGTTAAGFDNILIIVGVTFLFKGEAIIRQIFGQVSSAGTMKSLSQSAAATFAKLKIAQGAISTVGSYTVGEKSIGRKLARGVNNVRAIGKRLDAFDVTATKDEEYNIGKRLPNAPKEPAKDDPDYDSKMEKYKKDNKIFQAAAVLNNPKTHSYEEKAKAQEVLKQAVKEDPNHEVFKHSRTTAGQMEDIVRLDFEVQKMVASGAQDIDIEKHVTARLGVIFPAENEAQIKDRKNTYFTGLFMTGGIGGVSKRNVRDEVENTIKVIEETQKDIKFGNNQLSDTDLETIADALIDQEIVDANNMSNAERTAARDFTKNVVILNRRNNGEYTKEEILDAIYEVKKHANDNANNQTILENAFDSDLDIDTFAHAISAKIADEESANPASRNYIRAKDMVDEYEKDVRDGYYDDEVSAHEVIRDKNDTAEIDAMIERIYQNRKTASNDITSDIAKEILAKDKVDILEKGQDLDVLTQDGYTKAELKAELVSEVLNTFSDISPIKTPSKGIGGESIGKTGIFDLFSKKIIENEERERTGIEHPEVTDGFWNSVKKGVSKGLQGTEDYVEERRAKREQIRNDHFMGDVKDDDE